MNDLARALGPGFEIVVHDLCRPRNSIIAIAGNVTGRQVGAPTTDLVLRLLKTNQTSTNLTGYKTRAAKGKVLKSSTLFLHDKQGKTIGCLCINQDITSWELVKGLVTKICETTDPGTLEGKPAETFPGNMRQLLVEKVRHAIQETGKPVSQLDKQAKIEIVRAIDQQGLFQIRGATSYLAQELGVSRFTVYNYLDATCDGSSSKEGDS